MEKYECNVCNGNGFVASKTLDFVARCDICFGKGYLDWIEKVIGVSRIVSFEIDFYDLWDKYQERKSEPEKYRIVMLP
jgi:hypothetical protein